VEPQNGAQVSGTAVYIDWTNVPCADYFKFRLKQGAKDGPVIFAKGNLPTSEVTVKLTPARDDIYFAQAKACSTLYGCGKWSGYTQFRYVPRVNWQRDDWMLPIRTWIALR
jgi:hypothetical protein